MPKMIVTKRDAARRQLRAAIRLWFTKGDPVATHALTIASHEIIHKMFRAAGHRGLIYDSPFIKKEHRDKFGGHLRRHANAFKHANRGLDEEIEFDPTINQWILLMSVMALRKVGETLGMEESTLGFWMLLHHPRLFSKKIDELAGSNLRDSVAMRGVKKLRRLNRGKFFVAFQELRRFERRPKSGPLRFPFEL